MPEGIRLFELPAARHLAAGVVLYLLGASASAQQQLTPGGNGNSSAPDISDDAGRVAFQSTANLDDGGDNGDASIEIFVVDSDGSDARQLTASGQDSQQPSLSGDGDRVAFISGADFVGGNSDGNIEIFIVGVDGGGITQVTDSTGASGIQAPRLSADGNRLVFSGTADLLADASNADASREIFAIDSNGASLVQISNGPAGTAAQFADISPDGSQVVFSSNANPSGNNTDGNNEVFIASADGGPTTQLTATTTGQSQRPRISDDGRIAFESSANQSGNNADASLEIFAINANGSGLLQLTSSASGDSSFADISADGSRIAFQSTANPDGLNGEGATEIFIVDSDGGDLRQVSDSDSTTAQASLSADGTRLAFASSADLTGNNPDGNSQIFVVDPIADAAGNGSGRGNFNPDAGLFCAFAQPGCALCPDPEDDSDPDNADGTEDNTTETTRRIVVDPTLSLLAMFGLIGIVRRRGQR